MYLENDFRNDKIYQKWTELFTDDFDFEFLNKKDIHDFMKDYPLTGLTDFYLFKIIYMKLNDTVLNILFNQVVLLRMILILNYVMNWVSN